MTAPTKVDIEVATASFRVDLAHFFQRGRGRLPGWERIDLGPICAVVRIPAQRADGSVDDYFVRLLAECYPMWPPIVTFVRPDDRDGWVEARDGSRWWPRQQNSPGFPFGLHAAYTYPDGTTRQLVCFSHSLDYYLSNHTPSVRERWQQGRHTVTATLTRLADALRAPNYQGPSGDLDS